jgi:cell division protein FtsI (penicillin-binding protein 3)
MTDWLRRAARARSRMGLDPFEGERPDEAFETVWRRVVKQRVLLMLGALSVWGVALEARLVFLQVVRHADMLQEAENQQNNVIDPPAGRGDIVDRDGRLLAFSVGAASVTAAPRMIKEDAATAVALCAALGDCDAADLRELTEKFALDRAYIELRRRPLSPNQIAAVKALGLKGIYLADSTRRWYPRAATAGQLIGYVGIDNQGLGGVESKFDKWIAGQRGRLQVQVDAKGQRITTHVERAPTAGATVELTIDLPLQYITERELKLTVEANNAKSGTAVVMDPATGEVLSMASWPPFNPNVLPKPNSDNSRNRAVQDVYEPGSTFKIVTASGLLEEGLIKPTDLIDCTPGLIKFGSRIIRDDHRLGVVSFEDVIVNSSNVGTIKAGQRLGGEKLAQYIIRFGFGDRLSKDFSGESKGIVFDAGKLDDSSLASVFVGYQISVTPLQMAAAISAVANGGTLFEPRLVRAVIKDGARTATEPKILRRAISAETAATLTSILEEVVRRGTATAAGLSGYQVAGKTGTAKKVVNGAYSKTDFNASFVGFVPSRRPALAIVVVIDTPRGGTIYGGKVAAPAFKRIAEAALRQMGVPPTLNPVAPVVVTPLAPVRPASRGVATNTAVTDVSSSAVMPDVRNVNGREAVRQVTHAGAAVRVIGDGFVTDQSPAPGAAVTSGTIATLRLSRGVGGTTPGPSPGTSPRTTPGVRR